MKQFALTILALLYLGNVFSQEVKKNTLYNPAQDARQEINKRLKEAKTNGKFVFVQVGNNACVWCLRFNALTTSDRELDSIFRTSYIVYHLNTSKENTNEKLLASYRFPQRFGYPAFLILNNKGELIHTQNSVYLEQGAGYNRQAVLEFLQQWSPKALDPAQYKQR